MEMEEYESVSVYRCVGVLRTRCHFCLELPFLSNLTNQNRQTRLPESKILFIKAIR